MLSISEFSEMCQLPPQTLRYYHSEGLLVPAYVDEQTGYRSYTFKQVEQAMLITVLRGTGMSVKLVRRALDEPEEAPALLQQHSAEVERQRQAQDEAIRDARRFFDSWPEVRRRHAPEMTVVSKLVPGTSDVRTQYAWDRDDAAITATVQDVVKTVESCGAVVSGPPWHTLACETPEQKEQTFSGERPRWLVKIPVTADEGALAALPGDIEVQLFEAREELSIFIPGTSSIAKYCTALSRLVPYPLDDAYIDTIRMRHLLHDDGVETAAAIRTLDETGANG
ncbi:MerR family transcriptional regulator [Streptomyces sp. RPA4-5]|uniref:MerR family transcriptional regulator n=1 Tax=Streptomyces TaxID=1883 RepID=UPI00143EE2AC|nr:MULTISPECIES: MerR family transcriptional regulator [Streptomyces]MCX4640495.1 MerR family transcriptional regulator [Streptomyces platensis]QIY53285.1 MerR family transcriptional regulator [Streptomyces sp. RPA4-5]WJY35923.1 MerR family transcriptional regulator [Streptomyces sp. P9-2B-2]